MKKKPNNFRVECTKADIIEVGTVDERGMPTGFVMNTRGVCAGFEIKENGQFLMGGYTTDELIEIIDSGKTSYYPMDTITTAQDATKKRPDN